MAMPPSPSGHYGVLGLPSPLSRHHITTEEIKKAYRRALLQHHPDKLDKSNISRGNELHSSPRTAKYTIDDVSHAYKILSNPRTRAEYDRDVRLQHQVPQSRAADSIAQTGLETVDLDDLLYDEGRNVWYLGCRCGEVRGFTVTEEELEREKEHGEVVTGCRGCSLWRRVLFQVA